MVSIVLENGVRFDVTLPAKFGYGVRVGDGAKIGPYCVIGDHCKIGAGAKIFPNTRIANGRVIPAGAEVGKEPQ